MSALRFAVPYVAIAALLAACGSHESRPAAPAAAAPFPQRCTLRLVRGGRILVDGEPVPRATALDRCKQRGEALLYLDDPALDNEWSVIASELRQSEAPIGTGS